MANHSAENQGQYMSVIRSSKQLRSKPQPISALPEWENTHPETIVPISLECKEYYFVDRALRRIN